jgi:hypothetical protein
MKRQKFQVSLFNADSAFDHKLIIDTDGNGATA